MKTNQNKLKHLGLMILVMLAVMTNMNQVVAQTSDEDEEEEGGFFSDGIGSSRFESDFGSDRGTQRPTYEYKGNRNTTEYDATPNNNQVKNLDIEVDRHQNYNSNGVVVIGSGGGGGNSNPSNGYSSGNSNGMNTGGTVTPPIKRNNPNQSLPDNPGDPDVPIDGGIGFLLAAGLGYGISRIKKK